MSIFILLFGTLVTCSLNVLFIACIIEKTQSGLVGTIIFSIVEAVEIVCAVIYCAELFLRIYFIMFLGLAELGNIIIIILDCIYLSKKKKEDKLLKESEMLKMRSNSQKGKIVV